MISLFSRRHSIDQRNFCTAWFPAVLISVSCIARRNQHRSEWLKMTFPQAFFLLPDHRTINICRWPKHETSRLTCTMQWSWKHYRGRRMCRSWLLAKSEQSSWRESVRPVRLSWISSSTFDGPVVERHTPVLLCEHYWRAAKRKE